jgi:hypothetical protein
MTRVLWSAVMGVAAIFLIPLQSEGACLDPDIAVFYGNGIRTTAAAAELDRAVLEQFLNHDLPDSGQPPCVITVLRAYNRTERDAADLFESAQQEMGTHVTLFVKVLSWYLSDVSLSEFLAAKISGINYPAYVSAHDGDLDRHLKAYRKILDGGGRIIVVAHSQGNLFANEAYLQLLQEYGSGLVNRMRIVAVATPAGDVAGIPFVFPGPHTTLKEDFIHHVPGALDSNTAAFPEGSCGLPWDCHAFVSSYLGATGADARKRILEKVRDAFLDRLPVYSYLSHSGEVMREGELLMGATCTGCFFSVGIYFQPTSNYQNLSSMKFMISSQGTPTDGVVLKVYQATDGTAIGQPRRGQLIASSAVRDSSSINHEPNWYNNCQSIQITNADLTDDCFTATFTLPSPMSLSPEQKYLLLFERTGAFDPLSYYLLSGRSSIGFPTDPENAQVRCDDGGDCEVRNFGAPVYTIWKAQP